MSEVAIVTGAARNIGRAIAERLLRDGYAVVAADVDGDAVAAGWPGDVLATVYRHLGIDPEQELPDRAGRPVKVLSNGEAIREVL